MNISNSSLYKFDEQQINLDFVNDLPLFNSEFRSYVVSGQYTRDKQAIQEKYELEKQQLALERILINLKVLGATIRVGSQFAAAITGNYYGKKYTSSPMIRDAARTYGSHESYGRQKRVREGYAFSAFRTADFLAKWTDYLIFNVERAKLPMIEEKKIAALSDLKTKKDVKILNGLGISSSTSFEDIIYQQEKFGVHFTIECLDKEDQDEAEKIYYLFGYECKERKIPIHHNRILFDYLQCDPDFQNYRSVLKNEVFFNMIRELLKTGIFFIHKRIENGNKVWHFETENLENLEFNIININDKNTILKIKHLSSIDLN